jgi:CBS domain-containing protein
MHPVQSILESKERDLVVIAPKATVFDAVELMCDSRVGALLVMDDRSLVGIFSERDLMMRVVLAGLNPARTRVVDVMTRSVMCVAQNAAPTDVMAVMTDQRIRHLPVVDEVGRVVGIVSIGDLVRWTIREREYEVEQLNDYVTGRYPG